MTSVGEVAAVALAARLQLQSSIDDPVTGRASPADVAARSPLWPDPLRWRQLRLTHVTEQGARRLEEYRFTPAAGYEPVKFFEALPVAIMFEQAADGSSCARIYSAHELVADRKPMLPVNELLVPERGPEDILARYFRTLHAANLEATLELFEPDGYLMHSNGETYQGRERLRIDFSKFYQTGGIALRYCNKTDAGPITALECYMPSGRPAVAVYHRGNSGRMAAARLYL